MSLFTESKGINIRIILLTFKIFKIMKKILSIASVMALFVVVTLISCKKDEPKTFDGDFTNLTVELLESTLGVDSALIVDKLLKDGFVKDQYRNFVNDSYGLSYMLQYENGKVIQCIGTNDVRLSGADKWMLFKQENEKIYARNYALFRGSIVDFKQMPFFEICTKNPKEMKTLIDKYEYPNANWSTSYNNGNVAYCIGASSYWLELAVEVKNGKLEGSDTIFDYAMFDCNQ